MPWTHEAQPSESAVNFDYCDDEYRRRYQTTLHQFRLCIILYFILIKTLPSVIISALYLVVVRFI